MALYLMGIGFGDEMSLTLREVEALKECDEVLLEEYTNIFAIDASKFEKITGKTITKVDREAVEDDAGIIAKAKERNIALLISGDPLSATTHFELYLQAKKAQVPVIIYHNASVFTAIAQTGLQLYKFGATASIPLPEANYKPESFFDIFEKNHAQGFHSLFLVDPNEKQGKKLTVGHALELMEEIDAKRGKGLLNEKTIVVGCSALGTKDVFIAAGTIAQIKAQSFSHPCCFIIPGKLHFKEEEALELYRVS